MRILLASRCYGAAIPIIFLFKDRDTTRIAGTKSVAARFIASCVINLSPSAPCCYTELFSGIQTWMSCKKSEKTKWEFRAKPERLVKSLFCVYAGADQPV